MKKVSYRNILIFSIFHVITILTPIFFFDPVWLFVALGVWPISHGLGLAVGFHRLLTHRGFKTPRWVEKTLTIFGSLALQSGPIKWAAIHRVHHQNTDQPGDTHSPREGLWHSHIGWMIKCNMELDKEELLHKFAPDLCKDQFHWYFNKIWWVPSLTLAIALFYFFGLTAVLWVMVVRVTVGLEFTWMVNSVCHRWGSQPNNTGDNSKNNWLVAALTFGEGWHNNHHDRPTRARHGLKWNQIDFSWGCIWLMRLFRLASDVKL